MCIIVLKCYVNKYIVKVMIVFMVGPVLEYI